jgi:uncharacterized membrane protein
MASTLNNPQQPIFTQGKILSLSDSIYATAMTILVFNLTVPTILGILSNEKLNLSILELWPKFLAYLMSFSLLGANWVHLHFIFHHFLKINNKVIGINMLIMLFSVLIPFSTAFLGEYWQYQTPYFVFGGNYLILTLTAFLFVEYGAKRNLLMGHFVQKQLIFRRIVNTSILVFILIGIGLSYISPIVSLCFFVIFIFWHVLGTLMGVHERGIVEPG